MASPVSPFAWLVVGLVRFYQLAISPLIGPRCRFTPTCSQYAIEAVKTHGAIKGCWFAAKRLLRCHPLTHGGYDPVPPTQDNDREH
ncbi:membrane protein insertion efficiency factor YidD [Photobacterium sp. 1_MG-2023]|uniref:membrane protein insertion efficiency factor YidD n=1 Tax=Photobacterium sp. 1_MG-2023 TaxID=3062646 RepID=UPI0026E2B025|nr:membrane protein insertion efficiency factor YidD [Photobacterium sp. 1_MG-2023]MDO6707702.1 membrane protein insertion efficiency factor YidD [Photobacterium sp. 1_MG-2023]